MSNKDVRKEGRSNGGNEGEKVKYLTDGERGRGRGRERERERERGGREGERERERENTRTTKESIYEKKNTHKEGFFVIFVSLSNKQSLVLRTWKQRGAEQEYQINNKCHELAIVSISLHLQQNNKFEFLVGNKC